MLIQRAKICNLAVSETLGKHTFSRAKCFGVCANIVYIFAKQLDYHVNR